MAIRATPTARPSSPFPKFQSPRACFAPKLTPRTQFRTISTSLLTSATTSSITFLTTLKNVNAVTLPKDQIVTSLTKVESTIERIQEVGSGVLDFSQQKLEVVIKFALPILQKSGDQALKIASPVIEEVSKKTQEVIESSGIDTEPIHIVAQNVGNVAQHIFDVFVGAKPIALSALESILEAEPILIVEASGGLLVTYLFLPPILSTFSFKFRGYKGKLSAAQTLDLLSRRNYFMIDIRLPNEKYNAGVPLLPSTAKNKMIAVPVEELPNKVRELVRNKEEAEAGLTALKISYLKMINKHSNIIIMDSYCDMAKSVARELTGLGFKNCWVVGGGFSGNRGWSQSYLGKKSCLEVLSLPRGAITTTTVRKVGSEDKETS